MLCYLSVFSEIATIPSGHCSEEKLNALKVKKISETVYVLLTRMHIQVGCSSMELNENGFDNYKKAMIGSNKQKAKL